MTTPVRRQFALIGVLVGSATLVLCGFLTWLDVAGTQLSGWRMAELLTDLADRLPDTPPSWVGVVWYALPASGSVTWLLAFSRRVSARWIVAIGAVSGAACLWYLTLDSAGQPTSGPAVGLFGSWCVVGSAWVAGPHPLSGSLPRRHEP